MKKKKEKTQIPFGLPENRSPWVARELEALGLGWVAGE
jgi:hypothetical protein